MKFGEAFGAEGNACANDYHGNEKGLHPQTGPLRLRREGSGFVYKAVAASRLEQASIGTPAVLIFTYMCSCTEL